MVVFENYIGFSSKVLKGHIVLPFIEIIGIHWEVNHITTSPHHHITTSPHHYITLSPHIITINHIIIVSHLSLSPLSPSPLKKKKKKKEKIGVALTDKWIRIEVSLFLFFPLLFLHLSFPSLSLFFPLLFLSLLALSLLKKDPRWYITSICQCRKIKRIVWTFIRIMGCSYG